MHVSRSPYPLPSPRYGAWPPQDTRWACLSFRILWLMDAEDPESPGDLCAIPRGLPVRNSRCSLTHQPRHSALWPQPPGSTAPLLPHGGTDPEGLKERKPVAASPSSRPWASEVRKDTPGARPNPKANSPWRALNTPSDPHTAMHCLSLRSPRPRTTHPLQSRNVNSSESSHLCSAHCSPKSPWGHQDCQWGDPSAPSKSFLMGLNSQSVP